MRLLLTRYYLRADSASLTHANIDSADSTSLTFRCVENDFHLAGWLSRFFSDRLLGSADYPDAAYIYFFTKKSICGPLVLG